MTLSQTFDLLLEGECSLVMASLIEIMASVLDGDNCECH